MRATPVGCTTGNAALWPMLELASREPVERRLLFDKVIFVNDVIVCGGDLLRLLAHDADMACGYDFVDEYFWDNWVLEHGWDDHIRRNHERCVRNDSYRPRPPSACGAGAGEQASRVFCCWNGMAAFLAEPIYRGVRFRRGMREHGARDCSQSECSLFCADLQRLGYHRIMVSAKAALP